MLVTKRKSCSKWLNKIALPAAVAGLLFSIGVNRAKADLVYSVVLDATSVVGPGSCANDEVGSGNALAGTVGTLTLFSAGGLKLDFGGVLGTSQCESLFPSTSPTNPVVSTAIGTYTDLTGAMCNDGNCNGFSSYTDKALGGFQAAGQFLLTDQFPPPTSPGGNTNGGSFKLVLDTSTVPEPSGVALFACGILCLVGFAVRRRKAIQ